MGVEGNITFRFTRSPSGVISGVAFERGGDIVASFKLEVGKGTIHMHGKTLELNDPYNGLPGTRCKGLRCL